MIPVSRPYFNDDEVEEVKKVLESGWVAQGPTTRKFEEMIQDYLGVQYAVATNSCTSALHSALTCFDLVEGDEVLVADFTFPATGHVVLYCGAKPVFVDIYSQTYNICIEEIEEKISSRTVGIIPVHLFGQSAEMDEIVEIAKRYKLFVIEDAACAFGAKYGNKYAGTIGDIGCFSFHAKKSISTGEGGMCVTNNKDFADRIRSYTWFGTESTWDRVKQEEGGQFIIPEFITLGRNYKMSDISAAVGIAQLRKLDKIINFKRELARYYNELLNEISLIQTPYVIPDVSHCWQSYVVMVGSSVDRDELIKLLLKKGVQTVIGTYACHIQPLYNSTDECPVSLDAFNRSLSLPLYCGMSFEDIENVVEHLKRSLMECQKWT